MEAARDYAFDKVTSEGYYSFNQFDNPANSEAHYKTTGPEIWKDTNGNLTHFVATMGTTGTITGTGKFLKEMSKEVRIHGVQPKEGAKIPGIRKWEEAYLPKIYNPSFVDTITEVSEEEVVSFNRRLSKEEGIFAGISSGGSVKVGVDLCTQLETGVVVCIVCDRGDRYLSTGIF
jgi:cysteine synthase B